MTGLVVLDTVIGLVFIYLLYSIFVLIIQELIASYFSFRAKNLEQAICRMLLDGTGIKSGLMNTAALFRKKRYSADGKNLLHSFYSHPLIKYLAENSKNKMPSYIKKETFSKVILDLLKGINLNNVTELKEVIQSSLLNGIAKNPLNNSEVVQIENETLIFLRSLWKDAEGDITKFKNLLELWFDETMERASGWYKRNIQLVVFVIGLITAVLFNVDSIEISRKLANDPELRKAMIQQADAFIKTHPEIKDKSLDTSKLLPESTDSAFAAVVIQREILMKRLDSLINFDMNSTNQLLGTGICAYNSKDENTNIFLSILGWFITALAITFGAPFWFDLLNKLVKIRSSVATESSNK